VLVTYNVENLFDAVADGGEYAQFRDATRWGEAAYHRKLAAVADALYTVAPRPATSIAVLSKLPVRRTGCCRWTRRQIRGRPPAPVLPRLATCRRRPGRYWSWSSSSPMARRCISLPPTGSRSAAASEPPLATDVPAPRSCGAASQSCSATMPPWMWLLPGT